MTTRSGFSLEEWATLKKLFRRESTQTVTLSQRQSIRECVQHMEALFPKHCQHIKVIPVSTLDWSSTTFAISNKRVAFVDVEQANAVSFLLAKALLFERPIFAHIEFMTRASEAFLCMGKPGTSLLVAQKANSSLRSYAKAHGKLPSFPRPLTPDEMTFKALTSGLVLSFVTGHEIGHLLRQGGDSPTELEQWVISTYAKNETEPGRHSSARHVRFLKPECVQKFDERCAPNGDIVQSIKFSERWEHLKHLQIGEAHSDLFGLIATTEVARQVGIPPEITLMFILELLECSEMLMAFRRLLPRLPVLGKKTHVPFEHSNLGFRRFMFLQSLSAVRQRQIPVPDTVSEYWDEHSESTLKILFDANSAGEIESVSNRSIHTARAALTLSGLGHIPQAPTEEQIAQQYGPMAGTGFFLASCLKIPEEWMKINRHDDWVPNMATEALPMAYGAAVYDIAKAVKSEAKTAQAEEHVKRQRNLDRKSIIETIRHPRTQVFARRVIVKWPHDIIKSI